MGAGQAMQPVLYWELDSGETHTARLRDGLGYFLGRPSEDVVRRYTWLDYYTVYIIDEHLLHPPKNTGYTGMAYVSRLDTLIRTQDCRVLEVVDHGPHARGSKNRTLVNGVMLEKGASTTIDLSSTGHATISLTIIGPTFTLLCEENGKATITLPAHASTLLPHTIARTLIEAGIGEERGQTSTATAIVSRHHRKTVVEIEVGPNQQKILNIKTLTEEPREDETKQVTEELREEALRLCQLSPETYTLARKLEKSYTPEALEQLKGIKDQLKIILNDLQHINQKLQKTTLKEAIQLLQTLTNNLEALLVASSYNLIQKRLWHYADELNKICQLITQTIP